MSEALLAQAVAALKTVGLNYAFVLDVGERSAFLRGLGVTLQLCLLTIPCSLAAGVVIAAALTSGRAWLQGMVSRHSCSVTPRPRRKALRSPTSSTKA